MTDTYISCFKWTLLNNLHKMLYKETKKSWDLVFNLLKYLLLKISTPEGPKL